MQKISELHVNGNKLRIDADTDRSLLSGYPWHIAARSVLLRLSEPRHPPSTLSSLSAHIGIPIRRANFLSAGLPSNFSLEQESPDSYSDLPVFHRARTRREAVPAGRTTTTNFSGSLWSMRLRLFLVTVTSDPTGT